MSNRLRNHDQTRALLNACTTHIAAISQHIHAIIDRAAIPSTPDGFPRRASGAEPNLNPATPPAETDDPATWGPIRSDPTGEAATATPQPDPLTTSMRRMIVLLERAERELGVLAEIVQNVADPGRAADPDMWCLSCLRIGKCSPRVKNGTRCSSCRDFRSAFKTDPPVELLTHKHERGRWPDQGTIHRSILEERKAA